MAYSRGECRLKELLDRIGMKQAELARRTGYTPQMISKFARNKLNMSVEAMYDISIVIGCKMEDLYRWIPQQ